MYQKLGYIFLGQVILMTLLVAWLLLETNRAVRREKRLYGKVMHTLRTEQCTYGIISVFFGVSYFGRFYLNEYEACSQSFKSTFVLYMVLTTVLFLEGLSLGVLLMFHRINFRHGSRNLFSEEADVPYATIRIGSYIRFDTTEVDRHSISDVSTCQAY